MPAEWERHRATWIAWPHHEPDWPGKLEPIPWVYAEIVRVLHEHEPVEILCHSPAVKAAAEIVRCARGREPVEILCHSPAVKAAAEDNLASHGVRKNVRLHVVPNDR